VKTTEIIPATAFRRCALLVSITCVVQLVLSSLGFQRLFQEDAGGIVALLQVVGTLYSVLYAFATYVIWGQFTAVESEILKESGALKDLVIFSRRLKENTRDPVVRAIRAYARSVVETEWETLSGSGTTEITDKLFVGIVSSVTALPFDNEAERAVYGQLLTIMNAASAHRDERISLSLKRIPRTLLAFVTLTAIVILFFLFFYPFHNPLFGFLSIAVTTTLLFFAHFVVTDLDNPFQGSWNLSPDPFSTLLNLH
jgi:hypothetical protein